MKILTIFILLFLMGINCTVNAEAKTLFAAHVYKMGDNDSKNDARQIAFIEAKRKLVEEAGTYIESRFIRKTSVNESGEVSDFSRSDLQTYSAALLKTETVKEEWEVINGTMSIKITVKADIDISSINKQLAKIAKSPDIQNKIKEQNKRLKELEKTMLELKRQLLTTTTPKAVGLRQQRITIFGQIDKVEERYKIALKAFVDRKKSSVKQAQVMLKTIDMGMTVKEVEYILDKPDKKGIFTSLVAGRSRYEMYLLVYGRFSISFINGLVDKIWFMARKKNYVIKGDCAWCFSFDKKVFINDENVLGKTYIYRKDAGIRKYVLGR